MMFFMPIINQADFVVIQDHYFFGLQPYPYFE